MQGSSLPTKIVHFFSHYSTVHFEVPVDIRPRCSLTAVEWTYFRLLPIIKNQPFRRNPPSAARTEDDRQFAQNRLPHEGQPAAERAQNPGSLGRHGALR